MTSNNVLSADNQQERSKIQPWYIAGFVDGEGTFHIAIAQSKENRFGWRIIPEFHVNQNNPSKSVLEDIKVLLKCGYIQRNHKKNNRDNTWVYVVRQRQDLLKKVIPFFEKYLLRTKKRDDFLLFKEIVLKMSKNEHYTKKGIKRIINMAYQMNQSGKYRKVARQYIVKSLSLKSSETIRQIRHRGGKI